MVEEVVVEMVQDQEQMVHAVQVMEEIMDTLVLLDWLIVQVAVEAVVEVEMLVVEQVDLV